MSEQEQIPPIEGSPSETSTNSQDPNVVKRLLEVYDQISSTEDIAYRTAAMLTITNYYSHALRLSNIVNDRQGRNRLTVDVDSYKLRSYSLDTDVDQIVDSQLTELFVNILNTYLEDKQSLPMNKPKVATGIINRVKALLIMLTSTNQYGLIPQLNLPNYILKYVSSLFDNIQRLKEDILNAWIEYLTANGNLEMAEIVRRQGNSFWGSEGVKPNVIYDRYFGGLDIKEPIKTYEAYLKYRAEYRKSTKNVLPSKLYQIFDINADQYDKARRSVYQEIQDLFPEEEQTKRLIFEQ